MKNVINNTMRLLIILMFFSMSFCKNDTASQNTNVKNQGEEYAKELLEKVLSGEKFNAINEIVILPDKESAIEYAEKILFRVYSKETIESQKPYETYLIDGYWVIFGTLHYDVGGTFLIVINSKTGEVINIGHGK